MSDVKTVSEEKSVSLSEEELPKEADTSEEEACYGWKYWQEYTTLYDEKLENVEYTVPLKKISIKAHVNGSQAEICVEQRYLNPKKRTLRDIWFYYAVGEKQKLVEIQVNVDGKICKDTVRAVKEESMKMGNPNHHTTLSMKDRLKGRILSKIEIGDLRPKAEVVSIVKYVTEACFDQENLSTRLIIPTTLVPDKQAPERYQVEDMKGDPSFDPYLKIPMEIEVTGLEKGKVKYISSPSHIIRSMEQNPSDGTIMMTTSLPGTDPTEIENDFIVDIDWVSPYEAQETLTSLQVSDESSHPLKQVYIKARVINFIAEICTKLRYLNDSKEPVTVTQHRFPVEQGAAVVECTAKIDGELVKTEVKDGGNAKQEMQQAETSAILLEQLNSETLGISINKLRPNSEAIITIKYAIELPLNVPWVPESSIWEPSVAQGGSDPQGNINGAVTRLVLPATIFPAVPLKMEVITVMDNGIISISSPSHKIISEKQDCFAKETFTIKTSFSGKKMKLTDNDVILVVECDKPKKSLVLVEHSLDTEEEGTVVAVSFVPSFDLKQASKEVIFFADKSDPTIKEKERKRRLSGFDFDASDPVSRLIYSFMLVGRKYRKPQLIVTNNSFFNAVGFGKFSVVVFPSGSEIYCKETMKKAFGIVPLYRAMGAKNLDGALEHILQQSPKNGLPRQVILFIRGEVKNTEFILDLVRQHARNTAVFCAGIGDEVSQSFVKDIARAGGGTSHFIATADERQSVLMQLSKDAFLPDLKEMKLSWKDRKGEVSNEWEKNFHETDAFTSVSPSCKGDRLLAYGKFVASQVPTSLTVNCIKSSSKDVVKISRAENCKLSANILHRLVAQKLIRDLEKRETESKDMKERIATLALKYQLVSKLTSFAGKETYVMDD